jgi:transposase InsO family protein
MLTAPRSPTTTGKVERFHKTIREAFLAGKAFETLQEAQTAFDVWVVEYKRNVLVRGSGWSPDQTFRTGGF